MTRAMRPLRGIAGVLPLVIVCATAIGTTVAAEQLVDPPRLLFAERPAVLVLIDGDPIYRPIEGTDLERIANAKPFIVRDTAGSIT